MKFISANGGQQEIRSDQFVGFNVCSLPVEGGGKTYFVKAVLRNGEHCDVLGFFDDEKTALHEMRKLAADITEELKS